MITITDKKRAKIVEEIRYLAKYKDIYTNDEVTNYVGFLEEPGEIEKLVDAFNSFDLLKLTVQYMYTHIDDEGNIIRFDDAVKMYDYVRQYQGYFKRVTRDFVFIANSQSAPLFFIDVDNTLTDNGVLSEEKANYIRNFKYRDNIILSTGKASDGIMDCITACGLEHNYYSCLNGSVICKDGKYELINKLGKVSEELIDKLKKTGLMFIAYYENGIKKIVEPDEVCINAFNTYNERFLDDDGPVDYDRIVKILCFIMDDGSETEHNKELKVQEIASTHPELCCVRTAHHCYEILRKDQHKGNSVKAIAEKMGMYYRCSVGVGDSMNDYQMLNYTGESYIVATASEELKSHNFLVLDSDRKTDIVKLLKKYENREMV